MSQMGAGELLITSCDKDGTRSGHDIETLQGVSKSIDIPMIASGGAGSKQDIEKVFIDTQVSAVAVGSLFQFTEVTPHEIREHLRLSDIPVRSAPKHRVGLAK